MSTPGWILFEEISCVLTVVGLDWFRPQSSADKIGRRTPPAHSPNPQLCWTRNIGPTNKNRKQVYIIYLGLSDFLLMLFTHSGNYPKSIYLHLHFTSFQRLMWPQTKMYSTSDTITWHSFSLPPIWCDPFCYFLGLALGTKRIIPFGPKWWDAMETVYVHTLPCWIQATWLLFGTLTPIIACPM